MRKTLWYVAVITSLFVVGISSSATERHDKTMDELRLGVTGGYYSLYHDARFSGRDLAQSCCGSYNSVTSPGFSIGLIAERPVSDVLTIQGRLSYLAMPSVFTANEFIGNAQVLNPVTNRYDLVSVRSDFNLSTHTSLLTFTPQVVIEPFEFPLRLLLGGDVGYIITKTYNQNEQLTQETLDNGIRFSGGSSSFATKNDQKLNMSTDLFSALRAGVGYRVNVYEELDIIPEAGYFYGLTNFSQQGTWSQRGWNAGISITYRMGEVTPCRACEQRNENGECQPKICPPGTTLSADCQCAPVNTEVGCPDGRIYNKVTSRCDCPPETEDQDGRCVKLFDKIIGMHDLLVTSTTSYENAKKIADKINETGYHKAIIESSNEGSQREHRVIVKSVGSTVNEINKNLSTIETYIDEYCRSLGLNPVYSKQVAKQ